MTYTSEQLRKRADSLWAAYPELAALLRAGADAMGDAKVSAVEVGAWRARHDAMIAAGSPPYPWPMLDIARTATDATAALQRQAKESTDAK
jgi:hypothetical protein